MSRNKVFRFSRAYYRKKTVAVVSLGIDPGKTNTAFTVTRHCGAQVTVLESDMIAPYYLMRDFDEKTAWARAKSYSNRIEVILKKHRPSFVAMELFFLRGFRTQDGTYINFMIGMVAGLCKKYRITFLPLVPSNWKRKICQLGEKGIKTHLHPLHPTPHMIDSLFLSLFVNRTTVENLTLKQAKALVRQLPMAKTSTKLKTPSKRKKPKVKSAKPSPSARSRRSNS